MLRSQEETVSSIREVAKRALSAVKSAGDIIAVFQDSSGRGLSSGDVVGQSFSVAEAINEAKRVLATLSKTSWQRAGLATFAASGGVLSAVQAVEASAQAMLASVSQLANENRPFRVEDGPRVIATITGDEIVDAGGAASALVQNTETLKAALTSFLIYPKDDGLADADDLALVARQAKATSDSEAAAREALANAKQVLEEMQADLEAIRKERSDVESEGVEQRTKLEVLANDMEGFKSRSDTAAVTLEEHWRRADEAVAQLEGLLGSGEQRHEELSQFSVELSAVQERLRKAEARAEEANQKHKKYLENIERLTVQAEKMVSGATVAGLAKAFGDERQSLDKSMNSAMLSFFVGIAFIFAVTLLLAAYVFEIPIQLGSFKLSGSGTTPAMGDEVTVAGVLSRTVILLAPFWLTLFSARRYRSLFDLRQQYSHKYNMAFSVDGFKQQAPKFEQQIAAWVFHVVAEPPVTIVPRPGGMDENPLPKLGDIVKIPGDRFKELLDAAKKST